MGREVTWIEVWPRGIISVKHHFVISTFWRLGNRELGEFDIRTPRVLKSRNSILRKVHGHDQAMEKVKDLWIGFIGFSEIPKEPFGLYGSEG